MGVKMTSTNGQIQYNVDEFVIYIKLQMLKIEKDGNMMRRK